MQKKERLVKFIEKYYLNGCVESAVIEVEDKVLKTTMKTLEGELRGHIEVNDFELEDAKIGCYSTGPLLGMLSILNDDIDISFTKKKDTEDFLSIKVEDTKDRKITFATCELDLIERDGKKSAVKEYEVKIRLNQEIIDDILKSISVLDSNVTFLKKKDKFYAVINYSPNNVNSIEIELETEGKVSETFTAMTFQQKYLKNILEVNKRRFDEATIEISTRGIIKLIFIDNDSSAEYWVIRQSD